MHKRLLYILVLAGICFNSSIHAQWLTKADECKSARALPTHHSTEHESAGGGIDAIKWYWHQRTFGLGHIPQNAYQDATARIESMRANRKGMAVQATQPQWTFVGPKNIGGRLNAIAIDPTNSQVVYIGAANGGVWKTTNGGTSWTPLTDQYSSIAMGSLAIDPVNTNIVYAGTGELPGGDTYTGYGILRSSDGGKSWTTVGPTSVAAYSRIIVNPKHPEIVYAAAGRSGGGVLRSTDRGLTWNWLADSLPKNASVSDLALSMNGDNAVLYAGVVGKGVYRSKDGGTTWLHLDLPSGFNDFSRVSLTCSPTDWQTVAVLSVNSTTTSGVDDLEGIALSGDGGETWDRIDGYFLGGQNLFIYSANPPQGTYDVYIRMDPKNSSHMLVGGLSIWQTNDAGNTWDDLAQSYRGGIHPDQHEAAFDPSSSAIYAGNDGGLFYSPDASSFNPDPFEMGITEFYGIGVDQSQADMTYGGTQDNGTMGGSSTDAWSQIGGGDGSYTLVDPKTPSKVYCAYTENFPMVSINGGYPTSITSGINTTQDSVEWLNPFAADVNHDIIYWGCTHLYYTLNQGTRWVRCSKAFGSRSAGTTISALDAFGDSATVLVGTGGGLVYLTTDNGKTFKDISKGLPGRWISWVKFDPTSKSTFYVTCSGFGAGHIFKTTNSGTSWTNISGALPDIPVNTIVVDPNNSNAIYIGSDVGVFFSPNGGADWLPYGTGLPNVAVNFLDIQKQNRILRAGTHGRSIWQVPLSNDVAGIITPVQRTVWTYGDSAIISWRGFSSPVSISVSLDGGANWQSITATASGTSYKIDQVSLPISENVVVKVSDASQTLVSPLFEISQQKAGATLATVGEVPFYLYDVAYDPDNNVLWGTNFSGSDKHVYKLDPNNGTVLDSVSISLVDNNRAGLTGIAYDPKTKHLFINQVDNTSDPNTWTSRLYEVTTSGQVVKTAAYPSDFQYATGVYVLGDTIITADRMENAARKTLTSNWDFSSQRIFNDLDFSGTRNAIYGPRCLSYDTKLGQYLLAYTDFQGTVQGSQLLGSYVLFLNSLDGSEMNSLPIVQGGSEVANIRGMSYDPRGQGNTAWITILSGSSSAKLVKIALADGKSPSATPNGILATSAASIDFGSVDTGKTSTPQHLVLRNIGDAGLTINSLDITPANTAFTATTIATPLTLKSGDSVALDLTFGPHMPGNQSATLQINIPAAEGASQSIALHGNATVNGANDLVRSNSEGFSMEVSPNPAHDFVTVSLDLEHATAARVQLFDATGREVLAQQAGLLGIGQHDIDLVTRNLASGIYFVRVLGSNSEIATARLVIER